MYPILVFNSNKNYIVLCKFKLPKTIMSSIGIMLYIHTFI